MQNFTEWTTNSIDIIDDVNEATKGQVVINDVISCLAMLKQAAKSLEDKVSYVRKGWVDTKNFEGLSDAEVKSKASQLIVQLDLDIKAINDNIKNLKKRIR